MTVPDADELLERTGFDAKESILTRRQAEVLVLREADIPQADIAEELGTSRANVSSIEASARDNIAKARETVAFAEVLSAPVQLTVEAGTDLYDVPNKVYSACDSADVKVNRTAPELMKLISDAAGDAVRGRAVQRDITVTVTGDGDVRVRS
jgi:Tfx family DNA-binding protein